MCSMSEFTIRVTVWVKIKTLTYSGEDWKVLNDTHTRIGSVQFANENCSTYLVDQKKIRDNRKHKSMLCKHLLKNI